MSSVEQFYTLTATTQSGLLAQITVLGPKDSAGPHWGYTRANWRWATRYSTNVGRCWVAKTIVDLDIVITLPRWNPPAGAAPDVMAWWNGTIRTLERHDAGHKDISLRVAREILNGISRLPPEPSCDALNNVARAVNERWDAEHRRLHLEYDARTQHGRAQP